MKLILSILILFFSQTILTKELTLLCVGDSITEGSSTHSTYRHFIDKYLDQKLTHVGPFKDKNSLKHAGRGGWSVQRIAPKFKKWYADNPADIIILHANHNNFSDQKPIPKMIQAQELIIRQAYTLNPKVIIFYATPIPSLKLPKYSYLNELRKAQETLTERLQKDKVKVLLVRPEVGFDTKWLKSDLVHLKDKGADHMAKCFAEAINSELQRKK